MIVLLLPYSLFQLGYDKVVVIPNMGNGAVAAIFNAFFGEAEVSAAFFAQKIERTVAKKAVELLLILYLVAGEIFAVGVLKEFIAAHKLISRKVFCPPALAGTFI